MWRVVVVAVLIAVSVLLAATFFFFGGCERQPDPWEPPQDEYSSEAAAMPPGQVKVRLSRKPDALPPDAKEARFEWAVLASLQADRLAGLTREEKQTAAGKTGWTVMRYTLTVKRVGDARAEGVRVDEWVQPRPGMMYVRHEGELQWATFLSGAVKSYGTAGFAYHVPGTTKPILVFGPWEKLALTASDNAAVTPQPGQVAILKPWTYSVEAKEGPLADVIAPLLTGEIAVELPAKAELLRVGDAVTSLELRP
jgi:hypothetical protein